ncbi:MAG: guanylate kinase [Phycisphaerales bacterium]|nr:guanylate kinase [Phycisphaerales bacterium]MCI0630390.1 guanylate kinase [Phycisphaerales bacterium]MCI0675824.1 guanylate kinase [Phycisphaerales bacterium]
MSESAPKSDGLLLVISGPSGVGKTTITHEVERCLGGTFSVSVTTRPKAAGDVEGRDYYFISEQEFARRRDAGDLLEFAQVFGKYNYGTPRRPVEEQLRKGNLVILEIDVQGALQVKEKMPDAFMIFVLPPNDQELLRRLRRRGRDNEEAIQRRYAAAKAEIETARRSGAYDHFIVNDDLDKAVKHACDLVRQRRIGAKTC